MLSSIFQTFKQWWRPWGYRDPFDRFTAYILSKQYIIKGNLSFYNSSDDHNTPHFDYIFFADSLTPENREMFDGEFNFYFHISNIREISFFDDLKGLASDTNQLDPITLYGNDPKTFISPEDQISFTAVDQEPTAGGLYFCKIHLIFTKEELLHTYEFNSYNFHNMGETFLINFCFGITLQRWLFFIQILINCRACWLLSCLKKICPFMKFQTPEITRNLPVSSKNEKQISLDSSPSINMKTIEENSRIISVEQFAKLLDFFPKRSHVQDVSLVYSTFTHGTSLNTLYRQCTSFSQTSTLSPIFLLIIKDFHDKIFGALLSDSPTPSGKFLGNGECFVFNFDNSNPHIYSWSEENEFFMTGTLSNFAVGSDNGRNAIWIDETLTRGISHPCSTYNSPILATSEDFYIRVLELWAFRFS